MGSSPIYPALLKYIACVVELEYTTSLSLVALRIGGSNPSTGILYVLVVQWSSTLDLQSNNVGSNPTRDINLMADGPVGIGGCLISIHKLVQFQHLATIFRIFIMPV